MNLRKYPSHTLALLLFCGSTCNKEYQYISQEDEGYYTQNHFKLSSIESFEKTISMLESPDEISDFRKKLADRTKKWCTTDTEKNPDELWNNFFKEEIEEKIIKKLQQKHDTTLLKSYYDRFGKLLKAPTKENEKALLTSMKKLQANTTLMEAFKICIAEEYAKPKNIKVTEAILAYQECLYFICNKPDMLHNKLKRLQSYLLKWKKDGHKTGQQLWQSIQEEKQINKILDSAKFYRYEKNKQAIATSLRLLDQLANDLYSLSYEDLLSTLPHGITKLNGILYEIELKKTDDIKLLTSYLKRIGNFYTSINIYL
ncbi:protein of unknown function [Cardinium endosymbiont cEper1 of Encarsia pergandiella]|uniref:hypothetical protein n=1 Tax=Cardinium endosymbiont of Encarsia pergandiella TaxID=249402 RepID=UPI00027EA3B6|nr:hypothetical protein [Cardinium endosymbiont of Encarsia pergandiella]CCM10257.1 protein of unknown function [Cardinium endosymbiont cEper1 of Encarsia pergandiella]